VEVYWTAVTYKTVMAYLAIGLALLGLVLYLIAPEWVSGLGRQMSRLFGGSPGVAVPLSDQARFVNLEGKVQVKKVNSVTWVSAEITTTLGQGDLIQTGADGLARVVFPDGSTYTVKNDTLITVEESSVEQDRKTHVGVRISTGAVDLSVGAYQPGSQSEVSFENAKASLEQNTRAAVRTDPAKNQHEITIASGKAALERDNQRIELTQFERVSFPTGGPITRSKVLAPPQLRYPRLLEPIVVENPKAAPIAFEWQPVQGAVQYHLRVSTSKMFSQVVAERRPTGTRVEIAGLTAGDYFWAVTAIDAERRSSEPSETYKFTLAARGKTEEMLLEIEATQLHGNSVEVIGRTEPGAVLLINGQPVTSIGADGSFRYFTPPLARGTHTIVVVGQNRRGGTATQRKTIVIP
jgi:hypothetical protein